MPYNSLYMRTVGELLKEARSEKRLTLEEVEKAIRIRKKFLLALEENNWEKLPSTAYIKGFLRNYSSFLGLAPEEVVAVFRRQFAQKEKSGLLPTGVTKPLNEPNIRFTPQTFVVITIIAFLTLFFGYLFFQYRSIVNPPNLVVDAPAEGEILNSTKVEVLGTTDSDAVVAIDNQQIASLDNGKFSTTLSLPAGINKIVIESTSKYGKKKTITRTIQVQEGQ